MTETTPETNEQGDMKQYYVLGIVVLIAVVVAGFLLKPKSSQMAANPTANTPPTPTPTPGPITKLACDTLYYNPVIGFPKYYITAEGGDLSTANNVECAMSISVDNKVVATKNISSPLTDQPQRGGKTFRCTTEGLDLKPNVATVVNVQLKDDLKATASCSATFLLPPQ